MSSRVRLILQTHPAEAILHFFQDRLPQIPFAGRFALLFFFILASIVFYPYAETSGAGYYAFRILGAIIILLTVWAVTFSRGLLILVMVLAIPTILQHLFFHPHSPGILPFINRILSIAFDLVVIGIIARHVFTTNKPTSETIFGALCIYLLLGFTLPASTPPSSTACRTPSISPQPSITTPSPTASTSSTSASAH